jgi:hypothetical protein
VSGDDRQSVSHEAKARPTRTLVVHVERRSGAAEHADRSAESRLAEAVGWRAPSTWKSSTSWW